MNVTTNMRKLMAVGLGIVVVAGLLTVFLLMLRGMIPVPRDLELGPVRIHMYSLALLSAFLICVFVIKLLMKREPRVAHADVWEGLIFLFVPAIIGARIYHVLTDFHLYANNLPGIFAIWNGGLGFIGGVMGGALGLYLFARYRKLPLAQVWGIVAVSLPVGQAVGRLGNFFNHELYGAPTDLPWGQFIPPAMRKIELAGAEYFHPLFLYEALANLGLFMGLLWLWRRGARGYKLMIVYLGGYGIIRFILDFMRLDGNTGVYGLSYAQWLILFAYVAGALYYLIQKGRQYAVSN